MLKFIMFFLSPFYAWKTRRDTIKKMNLRTRGEILDKQKEFEGKFLIAEKTGNTKEQEKYRGFITLLNWVTRSAVVIIFVYLVSSSYAQEKVIIDKDKYKVEFIDDLSANNKQYVGWALIGTPYTSAMWRVMRLTYNTAVPTTFVVEWADGDTDFDNVIYNYGSLTYN